jgi:2-polyprenyl-3-methyl-5-hydroxy-6-metoxy-1,4-benzoquinol methylase
MSPVIDPEGSHLAALRRLADFRGARVLEMGCGDGRLTEGIAEDAAHVLAFDPDAEAVARARETVSPDLAAKVSFRVASAGQLEIAPGSFDLVVFSWSL